MSDTEDTWYAELRAQYQPEHVRLLLIGESAPTDHGGTRPRNFFYADHLGYDKTYKDRVQFKYYESGHMAYLNQASAKQLKNDIVNFVDANEHPVNQVP